MLAVDGMGGDQSPAVVVQGLSLARQLYPFVRFLLYGPEPLLQSLSKADKGLSKVITFIHTDEVITAETKPSLAIRGLKKSSMRLALEAVNQQQAKGVISAGNTGAYLALSKMILKTLPGIDRPAIISQVPTLKGESVMLDLGANLVCTPQNLVEFALMGEVFARHVLGYPRPTVGLLNVGVEDLKGHQELKETAELLKASGIAFHGFIEGDDISKGTVDVIVTDGFTGNVALKTGEGVIRLVFEALRQSFGVSLFSKLAFCFAQPVLKSLKERLDPRRYNGAVWLGLNGIAVKSHGGTDALGFAYAIGMAVDMVQSGLNQRILQEIQRFQKKPKEA